MVGRKAFVAVVVATALVACGGDQPDAAGSDAPTSGPPDDVVELIGTNGLDFDPEQAAAAAGEITIELTSEPSVQHNVVVEGVADERPVVEAAAGDTATNTVELDVGSYTFYCSVPGHRQAGMEGTLTVVAG